MLVSRPRDTEPNHWSTSKYGSVFHKPTKSPRMSNFDAPLSTQPDWHGQYSFLPPGDGSIFSQPYDHVANSNDNSEPQAQPRSSAIPAHNSVEIDGLKGSSGALSSPHGSRQSLDPLGLRAPKAPTPIQEHPDTQGDIYAQKAAESGQDESLVSSDATPGLSLGSNPISSVSSAGQASEIPPTQSGNDEQGGSKEDDEELVDDEEMAEGEADGPPTAPQTAAERTAQRRKMKRFRLTHQQTRFLMSEFAKQPHPDAAHRERLSREIPGLSPRQVQVWFQNRRAKIKRLTADDRDRMIKMRAVPDDFDNVQALHSPYGAVHGLGAPMASPVDFGTSPYADQLIRPLMVDVRRPDAEDHISPTGLSPAFGGIGFNPSASMSNPDILSPMSPTSGDNRYAYSNHLSNSPLSAGAQRTSNPFARQGSLDAGIQMQNHNQRQQQIRPLPNLHLRDTMTRSRSDTLQSPLRTSMSWKGDSIDYTTYHGGSGSPQMAGGRQQQQQSVYQPDQMSGASTASLVGYDSNNYSGSSNTVQSPTNMNYPSFQSSNMQASSMQQNPQNRSRLRAASASLPLGLDFRTQFSRSASSAQNMQPTSQTPGHRPTTNAQLGGVSSSYTGSFPSAPLTAPMDFSLPRTPGFRSSGQDYSMPQMSAPIAPPNDFSQAFQASMAGSNTRTPMRDSFGGSTLGLGQSQGSGERSDDYSHHDPLGMKRKRSFTSPSTMSGSGQQTYGHTT